MGVQFWGLRKGQIGNHGKIKGSFFQFRWSNPKWGATMNWRISVKSFAYILTRVQALATNLNLHKVQQNLHPLVSTVAGTAFECLGLLLTGWCLKAITETDQSPAPKHQYFPCAHQDFPCALHWGVELYLGPRNIQLSPTHSHTLTPTHQHVTQQIQYSFGTLHICSQYACHIVKIKMHDLHCQVSGPLNF